MFDGGQHAGNDPHACRLMPLAARARAGTAWRKRQRGAILSAPAGTPQCKICRERWQNAHMRCCATLVFSFTRARFSAHAQRARLSRRYCKTACASSAFMRILCRVAVSPPSRDANDVQPVMSPSILPPPAIRRRSRRRYATPPRRDAPRWLSAAEEANRRERRYRQNVTRSARR